MMNKKVFLMTMLIALLAAVFIGCGKAKINEDLDETPDVGSVATVAPTATPTPVPEYAIADVAGTWCVGSILNSAGEPLSDSKIEELGAGFSLELLEDGNYFVYDADSAVMGQGTYTVDKNLLTLSAADTETVYTIDDENTLSVTSQDDSVTVMVRCCTDVDIDEDDSGTDEQDNETDEDNTETDATDEAASDTPADE
jgi:hypothetical protein